MRRLILTLVGLLFAFAAQPAEAKPPLWIVRDADSQIVLFGSLHVLPAGLDWRPPELDEALAHADDLWFETPMDVDSQGQVSRLAYSRGQLPKGRSLMALLSPVGRERLSRLEAKFGLWAPDIDAMEPWLADVAVTLGSLSRQGAAGSGGVEQLVEASTPATIKRRAFETGAQQIDFFHRAPMSAQVALFEQTLEELDLEPGAYHSLVEAWMGQDLNAMAALGDQRLLAASPVLYGRLVSERNERWTKIILRRLAGHGSTVMIVGAGHLVGPEGLPARLRALGVTVEGP